MLDHQTKRELHRYAVNSSLKLHLIVELQVLPVSKDINGCS